MPPAPRIIPLLLLSKGIDACCTTEQMVAAPKALKPLPSQGMSVSEAALSPATTTMRSARPT